MRKIFYALFFLIPLLFHSQNSWKTEKSSIGIEIQLRKIPQSLYKEYKATTSIRTSIDLVLKELLEAPKYIENCEEGVSHLVEITDNEDYIFYVKNKFPWPIQDRDVVSKLKIQRVSENKILLSIYAAPNLLPELDNTLRIKEMSGYWLLEKMGGEVKVTQQLHIDPRGKLPSFVVNSLLVSGPFKTFKALKSKLEVLDSES